MQSLECRAIKKGNFFYIKSPSVGRICITISKDQMLTGGQVFGDFFQLNDRFKLLIPKNCAGKVKQLKNSDLFIPIFYNETILVIDAKSSSNDVLIHEQLVDKEQHHNKFIESPMDGMLYLAPSPKEAPFVKIGDEINPGDTIGLIEVMKCFYPLKFKGANKAKIIDLHIKDQKPVKVGSKIYSILEI